jgi:hypothetical protein
VPEALTDAPRETAADSGAVIAATKMHVPAPRRGLVPRAELIAALEVSEGNQRVLLHRARNKVRAALEGDFGAVEPTVAA